MFIPLRSVNIPRIKMKKWNSWQLLKRKQRAMSSCMLRMTVHATETFLASSENLSEGGTVPVPGAVGDKISQVSGEWSVVCVELARLVRRTSPLPAWTQEPRVCWVSCVLSWHVLSEGQVHYQRGHTSLECVECRVCSAGTSCQMSGSCTSHRSVTRCSWTRSW